MKLTPLTAAAIMSFIPITPCFSAPLTVKQSDAKFEDISLMPVSVTPNGIMVPDASIETMDTGLPFDSHPDNLDDFSRILNDMDPSVEEADTGHPLELFSRLIIENSTTNGTASSPSLNRRHTDEAEAKDGIIERITAAGLTVAANAPIYIVTGAGNAIMAQYQPELQSLWDRIFHHPKKPHKKPSSTLTSASFDNSTMQNITKNANSHSHRQLITPNKGNIIWADIDLFSPESSEAGRKSHLGHVLSGVSGLEGMASDLETAPFVKSRDTNSPTLTSASDRAKFREVLEALKQSLEAGGMSSDEVEKQMMDAVRAAIYVLDQAKLSYVDKTPSVDDGDMAATNDAEYKEDKLHLGKRQGFIWDDQAKKERENRMIVEDLRAALGEKSDNIWVQELCKGHPKLPDCALVNEYMERKNKHFF